ncbi:unnamed protein product [Prorocentrum cordatum]|uniref:Uncharacterized protein n=1 Tax=Prorocentrum cordatum TaxID=2364126 RepID=A0ABN9SIH0_9DINO|nr:unnamed protein product [Polarella glacialis]
MGGAAVGRHVDGDVGRVNDLVKQVFVVDGETDEEADGAQAAAESGSEFVPGEPEAYESARADPDAAAPERPSSEGSDGVAAASEASIVAEVRAAGKGKSEHRRRWADDLDDQVDGCIVPLAASSASVAGVGQRAGRRARAPHASQNQAACQRAADAMAERRLAGDALVELPPKAARGAAVREGRCAVPGGLVLVPPDAEGPLDEPRGPTWGKEPPVRGHPQGEQWARLAARYSRVRLGPMHHRVLGATLQSLLGAQTGTKEQIEQRLLCLEGFVQAPEDTAMRIHSTWRVN